MLLMKDILDEKNPILREISQEVPLPLSQEDEHLLMEMYAFLENSQNEEISKKYDLRPAVGIAAVQLGILKRMCAILIIDYDEDGHILSKTGYALANPRIVSYTPKPSYLKDGEGCLSVNRNVDGYVPRHAKVTIKGYDALTKQDVTIVARGFLSIACQHELDHFDGILFYDHINKKDPFTYIEGALVIE